jgi:hypothetical protein
MALWKLHVLVIIATPVIIAISLESHGFKSRQSNPDHKKNYEQRKKQHQPQRASFST